MSEKINTHGGVSFGGLLAVLFIGLKLGGIIDWGWVWVLSPLWLPITVILVIAGIILSIAAIISAF